MTVGLQTQRSFCLPPKGSAAARPIPFDALVITMDLRMTSPPIASRILPGDDKGLVELLRSCDLFFGRCTLCVGLHCLHEVGGGRSFE
jgi:hypothetical protein